MKKQLQTIRNQIARTLAIGLMLPLMWATHSASAQTANLYSFAATAGTFTPLVSPNNSSLTTTEDDNISSNIAIGFPFNFEGTNYTQLRVASNGYLIFGTSGTSSTANNLAHATASRRPGIAPLWDDLQCTAGVTYLTSGTAPFRTFTAEWLNMAWNYGSGTAVISFQAILHESTNVIEFIYRQEATAVNNTTSGASIGIMGTSSSNYISVQDVTLNTVSTSTSQNGISTKPATGQVYQFTPPACSGTPIVGTLSLAAPTACGTDFTILQTMSAHSGITFQWQDSLPGGAWANIPSSSTYSYYSALPGPVAYYKCIATCSNSSLSSTSNSLVVNPPVINGGSATITANPACAVPGFSLNVTGSTAGVFTYEWQDSVPGGAWANTAIATASTNNATLVTTANPSTPTYFRRQTICLSSSGIASSNPVLVQAVFGGVSAATLPVCGDSLTLSLTGNSSGAGISFQWEESTDTLTWSPILDATNATQKVISPSAINYYRCVVSCGIDNNHSTFVRVRPVVPGTATVTTNVCLDSTVISITGASTGSALVYDWLISTDSINWISSGVTTATGKFPSLTTARYFKRVTTCGSYTDTSLSTGSVVANCGNFGTYSITRSTNITYSSIQSTGNTFLWKGTSGDDASTYAVQFPSGFNFTYDGAVRPAFYACTNGWLTLDSTVLSTAFTNDLGATTPHLVLAPFWEDLVTLGNTTANQSLIKWQVQGTSPNRVMVVEWAEMERFNYGSPNLNFQVRMYEGTNNIEYVYGRMQPFDGSGTGEFSYSIGMTGNTPGAGQRLSLQVPNTSNFMSSVARNDLSIVPACNTSYLFTKGGTFNPTTISAIPSNDSSSTPILLAVNPVPCTDACGTYYTSRNATASNVGPNPVTGNADDDVWFSFVAPASGQVNISIISSSGYDPAFMVMSDLLDTTGLGAAASRNNASNALESVVATGLISGNTYLIRVFNSGTGSGSTSGAFAMCVNEVIPPPANDDTTGAILLTANTTYTPTAGTTLGATASAQAVCAGLADDDVWFKFTPNNYTDTVSVTGIGTFRAHVQVLTSGLVSLACQNTTTNGGTVKFALNNLKKDSTYYIRVYHTNAGTASANFNIGVYNTNGVSNDLQAVTLARPVQQTCFAVNDSVFVTVRNLSFDNNPYDLSIDNATVNVVITDPSATVTTLTNTMISGFVNPNSDTTVFVGTFNFTIGGTYAFRANVNTASDLNNNNDTTAVANRINNVFTLPYVNNFETPTELTQGSSTGFFVSGGTGVNASQGLRYNFYSFATTAQITSIRFTGTTSSSAFAFKYKITDYDDGTAVTLGANDSLVLEVSTDCGVTYTGAGYIAGSNHTATTNFTTKIINLGPYSPSDVFVRIRGNWNGTLNDAYVDIDSFYVYDAVAPTVLTTATSGLADISANVSGNITSDGGSPVVMSGVVLNTTADPSVGDVGVIEVVTSPNVTLGTFTVSATGLVPNTQYHYRAYAMNGLGISYGVDSTFTTLSAPVEPGAATVAASDITTTTATVGGNILFDGGSAITASGIVFGTSPNPTIGGSGVDSTTTPAITSGGFSFNLTGLNHTTKYYYRAYAINGIGTGYSVEDSFTTALIVTSLPYTENFDAATTPLVSFGPYTIRPLGLASTTKYYFRAYATNGIGTNYSTLDSVTTIQGVSIASAYSENFEGGAANWTAVTLGTANDWILGTPAKTYLNSAHSGNNSWNTGLSAAYSVSHDAAVTSPVLDCAANTDTIWLNFYHKFLTEPGWDGMIVEMSIDNGPWTKLDPVIGTGANYNTTLSKAWYTSTSTSGPLTPPKFSSVTTGVGSSGLYSSQVNGWVKSQTPLLGAQGQSNVRVRFRFASDPSVTQEGMSLDDITIGQKEAPVVNSKPAINITQNAATVRGEIMSDGGGTITTSGILISTTPAPAIGDPGVIDSVSTTAVQSGVYSFNVTGLANATTYYTRAYAINAVGTSYGADSSFTTLLSAVLPTVTKTPATSVTVNSAILGGNISSDGGDPVTASGIVYGTSPNPSIGDPGVVDSTTSPVVALGFFNINPTGLTHTTKYYYRAYATNVMGTAYSDMDSFTTSILITSLPYTQNFESGQGGWTAVANGGDNPWEFGTPSKTFMNNAYSGSNAWVTKLVGTYSNVVGSDAVVVSPQIDMTAVVNPVIRFKHKFDTDADINYDGGVVEISINGGAWTRLNSATGTGTNFNTATSYAWYNNASALGTLAANKFNGINSGYASVDGNGWIESAAVLTGAAGQSNVKVRFRFWADAIGVDEGWEIDDIEIVDIATPTTAASAVNLTAVTNTTTTVNWTNGDGQGRLVVARLTSTAAVAPTDNTLYTASGNAFGGPDVTGTGNYIIYQSNGASVVATGLALLTDYTYDVYEYNGKYMHVRFAAAASNNGSTLPVTLTTFTATAKAKDALLNWTTASETNNRGFEIERSLDGRSFEKVDFVKGAGNSSRALNYAFTDLAAFTKSGVWFYRLKQVDFDGKFTYSQIVRVSINTQQVTSASVHPNPFKSDYTLSFSAAKQGVAVIEMMDMQGRVVSSTQVDAAAGTNAIEVTEAQDLKAGVYFVKVTINGESQTLKLVKE